MQLLVLPLRSWMMLDKILRFSELQFTCKEGVKIALLPPESHYYKNFAQRMIGYTGGRCRYEDLQSPKHRHLGLSTGHDKTSVPEDEDGTLVFLVSPATSPRVHASVVAPLGQVVAVSGTAHFLFVKCLFNIWCFSKRVKKTKGPVN